MVAVVQWLACRPGKLKMRVQSQLTYFPLSIPGVYTRNCKLSPIRERKRVTTGCCGIVVSMPAQKAIDLGSIPVSLFTKNSISGFYGGNLSLQLTQGRVKSFVTIFMDSFQLYPQGSRWKKLFPKSMLKFSLCVSLERIVCFSGKRGNYSQPLSVVFVL